MGFHVPNTSKLPAQGDYKVTMRWDLMRPGEDRPPNPHPKPQPLRLPSPRTKVQWVADLAKELPQEVSLLATLGGSRWWNGQALKGLKQDYANRGNLIPPCPAWVREMAAIVAERHDIPLYLIFGRTRCKRVAHARQELCFLLRHSRSRPSYPQIAKWLRRADHTTVIWAANATRNRWARVAKGLKI